MITGPHPVTSISKVHTYKGSRREILLNPGASPDLPFILPDNKLLEGQVLLLHRECGRSSRESEDWEPAGEVFSRIPGHHRNNFIEMVLCQTDDTYESFNRFKPGLEYWIEQGVSPW